MRVETWAAALLAVVVAGCGGEDGEKLCNGSGGANRIEGSYCEDVEMRFTETRLLLQASAGDSKYLFIEYVRPLGTGLEKTLLVGFNTSQLTITEGERISFLPASGTVRRVLTEGSVTLTSELDSTTSVTLDSYSGEVGTDMSGHVDLSFTSGRKLTGYFSGTLAESSAGQQ